MFAASSSGVMPPTNGMVGSLHAKKQRVHVGPQRTRNLQQHWANGPSSSSQPPYGSLNGFGTTAAGTAAGVATATAATACPTAASPRESHSSSVNFSTATTTRTGPPATLGGDAGINGVTTAFASMGLPQVGASTPQPLRPLQQQQQQQQDDEQRRRQQQKEQRRQQMQQTQEKKQQKQQKRQQKQQQKQQQRQQEQQQQQQLQQQLQEKQEQQQQLQQQLQQLQHQLLQQKQQLLQQKQEQELEQEQQEQQQQEQQPQQQQQAQQHKHKQQKQRETRQSQSPFSAKPIDLRLQLQTSKLAFITSKRSGDLLRAGFTLRRETGHGTVQEFLDKTRIDRKPYGGRGLFGFPPTRGSSVGSSVFRAWTGKDNLENSRGSTNADDIVKEEDDSERGGGGAARTRSADQLDADHEEWRDMTFAYSEMMGWVFLHHATEAGVELVHELIRTTHGQEIGIFSADSRATDTVEGFASALESSRDVSVIIKGAIVHICGTLQQVRNVSKAIEAIANGTSRMYAMADWYWRGEPESTGRCPWYPMSSEADAALEAAFNSFKEGGRSGSALQCYEVGGLSYAANFKIMAQINKITGYVRPIKRMITDRQGCPLPRCPKENMPITCFREGTHYSLVTVTKEEDVMVREAVEFTYTDIPVLRVEHVWNSFLWGHYAQNAKSVGNECLMFHGAPAESLNQICRTGFDRRLAGSKHGARFGQGCYFARDASYSALYMKTRNFGQGCEGLWSYDYGRARHEYPPPQRRCFREDGCWRGIHRFFVGAGADRVLILLAKVLVGEFTVGNSTMVKPPKMSGPAGGDREYDTTSDDPHSPQLIVTYKDWMAYPMYLITFGQQPPETEEN